MQYQRIIMKQDASMPYVAQVILTRSEVRNSFDDQTVVELTHVFEKLSVEPGVRAIILSAAGRAFCAGADLNWMKRMSAYSYAENCEDARVFANMMKTIDRCPKPVIARVQGDVYAGGVGLVAIADIAIASDNVQFCLSEARLGLVPAVISPYVLRAIGARAARRYFLTAECFDAACALRIGLLHDVVAAEQLDDAVQQVVQAVITNSPHAVQECKQLIFDCAGCPIDSALIEVTAQRIAQVRASSHAREGIASFLEKRKPSWSLI